MVEEESLGGWVGTNRAKFKKGELSEESVKSFEELDYWTWDSVSPQFMEKLEIYKDWIAEHGTPNVPDEGTYIGNES